MHKKTTTSSGGTDSHHQPVASPEENAPATYTPPNHNSTEPPSSTDKKPGPVLQDQNATNCKLPTSKVQAKTSATNDCKPEIPIADDNSSSTNKDIDPAKQKSKLFDKRKSLCSVFPAKQAKKKKEKSRGSQRKKAKIDDKQEEKISISSKTLKQPTMLNFQTKVVRYKAVQIPKELGEVFLHFARDNTLNNTETCGVLGGKDAGTEFVVTRLIMPKQQRTSDS